MFYDTAKNDHGLPRDPFKAIVAPRPIGWITSMSAKGEINLAPYSFFNAVSDDPPIVLFSSEGPKDSLVFVQETKEFVCNLATFDLRAAVVETSAQFPRGVNEMARIGPGGCTVPAGPPAAGRRLALRARMQAPPDHRSQGPGRQIISPPRRAGTGGRHPYRRPLHQGWPARYRRDGADRALRLRRLFRRRQGVRDRATAAPEARRSRMSRLDGLRSGR